MTTEFCPGQLVKVVSSFAVSTLSGQLAVLHTGSTCLFLGSTHKNSFVRREGYDITYMLSSDGVVFYTEWWGGLFCDGSECYVEPFSHIG